MAIKANELRIGNWVKFKDNSEYHKIKGLYDKFVVSDRNIKLCGNAIANREDQLFGIPLTFGILGKCGFGEMTKEDKDNLDITETERLVYKDSAICCYWDGTEWIFHYGLDSDLAIAACEYLHQFQNLLFCLTGEELTYTP